MPNSAIHASIACFNWAPSMVVYGLMKFEDDAVEVGVF